MSYALILYSIGVVIFFTLFTKNALETHKLTGIPIKPEGVTKEWAYFCFYFSLLVAALLFPLVIAYIITEDFLKEKP